MKIKKEGEKFFAYRDENDVDVKDSGMNKNIEVGDELGEIDIDTGRFVGNTFCLVELSKHRDEYVQRILNRVKDSLKKDIENGDTTVLEELLKDLPTETLIQSLPKEKWEEFR